MLGRARGRGGCGAGGSGGRSSPRSATVSSSQFIQAEGALTYSSTPGETLFLYLLRPSTSLLRQRSSDSPPIRLTLHLSCQLDKQLLQLLKLLPGLLHHRRSIPARDPVLRISSCAPLGSENSPMQREDELLRQGRHVSRELDDPLATVVLCPLG